MRTDNVKKMQFRGNFGQAPLMTASDHTNLNAIYIRDDETRNNECAEEDDFAAQWIISLTSKHTLLTLRHLCLLFNLPLS